MFGFNNAEPIDVGEANKRLREECQGLLLQVNMIIHYYFTNTTYVVRAIACSTDKVGNLLVNSRKK